jgi:FkbM family methyltransferase
MSLRRLLSSTASALVDALGGVPVTLPDGSVTRVAFRARYLARNAEKEFTRRFLAALRPEMLVLDVGAYVGLYALMAAPRVKQVIAFEPAAENAAVLARNVRLAGLKNVEVRQQAVSDRSGALPFYDPAGDTGGPSMTGGLVTYADIEPRSVEAVMLDSLELSPHVMKVDVEGGEAGVIQGGLGTLRRCRPALYLEIHRAGLVSLGSSPAALYQTLAGLGYRIENLTATDGSGDEHLDYSVQQYPEHISYWICQPGP